MQTRHYQYRLAIIDTDLVIRLMNLELRLELEWEVELEVPVTVTVPGLGMAHSSRQAEVRRVTTAVHRRPV